MWIIIKIYQTDKTFWWKNLLMLIKCDRIPQSKYGLVVAFFGINRTYQKQ